MGTQTVKVSRLYFFTLTLQTPHSPLGVKIAAGPGGDNKCPSFYPTSEAWSAVRQDTSFFAQNQKRGLTSNILKNISPAKADTYFEKGKLTD